MKNDPNHTPYTTILIAMLLVSVCINVLLLLQLQKGNIVTTVYDGDSFELADGRRVRLLGVDAPEAKRCMGPEAKSALTRMIAGKRVRLKNGIADGYGRIVANAILEDQRTWFRYLMWKLNTFLGRPNGPFPDNMVNRAMVRSGMAKVTSVSGAYRATIDAAAMDAKTEKLGIFSDQCRNPSHQSGCDIKGNIRQGKKYYFIPGCKPYGNVIVDESFGDAWFCTAQDAQKQGFSQAPTCMK